MSRRAKNPKNKLAWGPINLEPKSISVSEAIYFIVQGITAKGIHSYVVEMCTLRCYTLYITSKKLSKQRGALCVLL